MFVVFLGRAVQYRVKWSKITLRKELTIIRVFISLFFQQGVICLCIFHKGWMKGMRNRTGIILRVVYINA